MSASARQQLFAWHDCTVHFDVIAKARSVLPNSHSGVFQLKRRRQSCLPTQYFSSGHPRKRIPSTVAMIRHSSWEVGDRRGRDRFHFSIKRFVVERWGQRRVGTRMRQDRRSKKVRLDRIRVLSARVCVVTVRRNREAFQVFLRSAQQDRSSQEMRVYQCR